MRRCRSAAWEYHECYTDEIAVPSIRKNVFCLCIMMCAGHSLALVSPMALSNHFCHRWKGVSSVGVRGVCTVQHRFISVVYSSSKGVSDAYLDDVDFDSELDDGEAKVSSGEVDDVSADKYFGRFITEALKEEEIINIRVSKKELSLPNPKDESPVDGDVDRQQQIEQMLRQQQQQIDLLMELVKHQGQQQLPPQSDHTPRKHRGTSTSAIAAKPKNVTPLKAMLFIDGTWLYYSLNTRNPMRDAVIPKFGMGWQNNYKVDWQALPRLICTQIEKQRNSTTSFSGSDRPLEISRVMVFTSAKKETDPNSIRMRMFREMAIANYDVYMMETIGQGEKCVDIQLAVEMLHYATVPNAYDVAILLSGDKDFVPALVRTRQKGKQVCISSMRAGCNRVLYESYPHIRDYDVVWLENCLDELIVPISEEERSRRDRAGYASSFTMMRVVRDFVEGASDHVWVSSRDIGKYLKNIEIGDSNMLEELKQVHGGLRTFLMERGCNLFDVKFPDAGTIRGRGEFAFWVKMKGDSDASLLKEFKRTQYFTKEEKEFLESYKKEKFVADDSYEHTTTISHILDPNFDSDPEEEELWRVGDPPLEDSGLDPSVYNSSPSVDYSQLTVVRLKDICREKGLQVTGNKDVLIDRLEQNRKVEHEIIEKRRKVFQELKEKVAKETRSRPKAVISTKPRSSLAGMMPAGGNIYASTLPQVDMIRARNTPRNSSVDSAAPHLEGLIKEYLTASGGSAGSRDIGRYLAANSDSLKGNRSALSELKENFGTLLAFILSREDVFSVLDKQGNGDDTGFPIKLKTSR